MFGLYRLAQHDKNQAVFIVEGEKCAAALQSLGLCAVTSLGGCNAAKQADWTPLNDFKTVFYYPTMTKQANTTYAQDVYQALTALESPPTVKILRLAGLPKAGDIVDWLQGWVDNWDGYAPIAENLHAPLKEKLRAELANAEPAPDSWNLAGSCSSVLDWETANEDDDGQAVFNQWLIELQTIKIKQEEKLLMVEHFGKFRGFVLRATFSGNDNYLNPTKSKNIN